MSAEPAEPVGPASPMKALRYDQRPPDHSPLHTSDLPETPVRDRSIPASAWIEAPDSLLTLGDDLPGRPLADYKRRIGPWLLWRAGPATRGHARYWAAPVEQLSAEFTFRLYPDGDGDGVGPSGARHTRFRAWKEDLRDTGPPGPSASSPPPPPPVDQR